MSESESNITSKNLKGGKLPTVSRELAYHSLIHQGYKPPTIVNQNEDSTEGEDKSSNDAENDHGSGMETTGNHCTICDKSFDSGEDLRNHCLIHLDDKQFACDLCDKSFSKKVELSNHYRTHTGDTPYKCSICFKLFRYKCTLTRHLHVHTGTRPHTCVLCNQGFWQKAQLMDHKCAE
ncbi:hypothetical protein CDAR_201021 [Caerostris darwini]|uniref:C2H2-type domain-containing protein n=1 Tax=Caerostris darwini TaxID=1538125 RepID=A0AAV4P4F6_9ARAC|nr:hypothetical protein CDAR_201021 [Caerostris darwini]